MIPYTPIPRIVPGDDHLGLIHRILRPDVPGDTQRIDLITTSTKRISLVDSGNVPDDHIAEGDTAVHVLWQHDERDASTSIGEDRYPIAPGDTVMIPGGDAWKLSPNTLAITVSVRSRHLAIPVAPTHGDEIFEGYNRESRYPSITSLSLSRWKLTETLYMPVSQSERILVGLYGDIAMQYERGISMIAAGRASVIRPETGPITLIPNGLSYVLVID